MRNIDEETHLHLVDFFLMLLVPAFKFQFRFHTLTHPEEAEDESDKPDKSGEENHDCPPGLVPDRENYDFQHCRYSIPFSVTIGSFYQKVISALWQVGVGDSTFICQIIPLFVISFQFISESIMLSGNIIGYYKFNRESSLPWFQGNTFCLIDILSQDTGFIIRANCLVKQLKFGDNYRRRIRVIQQQFRAESSDPVDTPEIHLTAWSTAERRSIKLITL